MGAVHVGDLGERELNQLVHFYPGSVYKASFVTADDAVQWLWLGVSGCQQLNGGMQSLINVN